MFTKTSMNAQSYFFIKIDSKQTRRYKLKIEKFNEGMRMTQGNFPSLLKDFKVAYDKLDSEALSLLFKEANVRFKGTREQGYQSVNQAYIENYFQEIAKSRDSQHVEFDEGSLERDNQGYSTIKATFHFAHKGDYPRVQTNPVVFRFKTEVINGEEKISEFGSAPSDMTRTL